MPAPTPILNPLSRRPQTRRLVVAVRGAAGVGKSVFAASLADAGLGRLCLFDTERKARLLPGSGGQRFDALEIEHPDELPQFIDWALGPEGQKQGYTCYALDSWAMYFGRKHRELIETVRARTGDVAAQPNADELAADQMVLQEVLRRLCVDSGACVVITDQIAAKNREAREENERGRVVPMTASGLEYFVDVMLELSLRVDGFETVRVARVVKSNSPAFPVGFEIDNPTFRILLDRMEAETPTEAPVALPEPAHSPVSAEAAAAPEAADGPTLADLVALAERCGVARPALVTAARHYVGADALSELAPADISALYDRLTARYGTPQIASDATSSGDGAATRPPARPSAAPSSAPRARTRPSA